MTKNHNQKALPLERYAMIGDCETAALVGDDGSIDWLCWPTFSSDACFARLLGSEENGRWLLAPAGKVKKTSRKYREHTLILETTFETAEGIVTLIDFMPIRDTNSDLVRIVKGVRGSVPMKMDLILRFGYGFVVPWATTEPEGWQAIAGPDLVILRTSVPLQGVGLTTVGEFTVNEGESVSFAMTYGASHLRPPRPIDVEEALHRTQTFWEKWTARCAYHGPYRAAIERSLITLKALIYQPTGGIVAAVTTSLPEQPGGSRNWDYRYCWLRDTTFTLLALMNGGYYQEARQWQAWLLRAVAGSAEQVQIMYGLAGQRHLLEWEIPWLGGYEDAKPVRVGNAASGQLQLDIYGELLDAFWHALDRLDGSRDLDFRMLEGLVERLEHLWEEPDHGIWETRGCPQHFTYSKVMAWVAFDRAIRVAEKLHAPSPVERWGKTRDKIHAQICTRAYNPALGSFVQAYGSDQLDASLLLMPLVGFLPHDDERVKGTIAAIEKNLMRGGLVMRYNTAKVDDGLAPGEGVFLACSFWMVSNMTLMDRREDAKNLFEHLLSLANDVGLLSEEYDIGRGRLVGNFPQGFSHIALVNAAFDLANQEGSSQQRASKKPKMSRSGTATPGTAITRNRNTGSLMHTFEVWAPAARAMEVKIGERKFPLTKQQRGWWSASVEIAGPGTDYLFLIDGKEPGVPDPRSFWQPNGVHGPSRIFDPSTLASNDGGGDLPFDGDNLWSDAEWTAPPFESAVVYELHIGTFTPEGTLSAAEFRLAYLKELGISHIQLMPLATFPGDRGWGYDGVDLYAPHPAYGGPLGVRHFVNACHEVGLAVLLDVVYNHLGPTGNYLGRFAPYFTAAHCTPWGEAVNLEEAESTGVRRFLIDNALMWLRDYHFDGLRLDAVHAFVDRSALHFLEQVVGEVRDLELARGKRFVVIAESDLNDPRLVRAAEVGGFGLNAQWSDDFHHALFAALTGERRGYYQDFGSLADLGKALREVFVYDGNYSEYRRRNHGRPARGLPGHRFLGYAQNHDQVGNRAKGDRLLQIAGSGRAKIAAALVLTSPFIPLLFQGEEFGASAPFHYFTGFEDPEMGQLVSEGRKREFAGFVWSLDEIPDPQARETFEQSKLDWSELKQERHAALLQWHKDLIRLRRASPDLMNGDLGAVEIRLDEEAKWFVMERGRVRVACNLGKVQAALPCDPGAELLLASDPSVKIEGRALVLGPDSVGILLLPADSAYPEARFLNSAFPASSP